MSERRYELILRGTPEMMDDAYDRVTKGLHKSGAGFTVMAAAPLAVNIEVRDTRPDHRWNDPDDDGHNCADCPNDSMWKCDRLAHLGGAYDLLTSEQRADLDANLRDWQHKFAAAIAREYAALESETGEPRHEECGHLWHDHGPHGCEISGCPCLTIVAVEP